MHTITLSREDYMPVRSHE